MSYSQEAEKRVERFNGYKGLAPLLNLFHYYHDGRFLRPRGSGVLASVNPKLTVGLSEQDRQMSMWLTQEGTEELLYLRFLTASPGEILRHPRLRNDGEERYVNLLNLYLGWIINGELSNQVGGLVLAFDTFGKFHGSVSADSSDYSPNRQKWVLEVLLNYENKVKEITKHPRLLPKIVVPNSQPIRIHEIQSSTCARFDPGFYYRKAGL